MRYARQLLHQAEKLVEQAVVTERSKGTSWDVIGEELGGVTKSAAQKRYGARVERWKSELSEAKLSLPPVGQMRTQDLEIGLAYGTLKDGWQTAGAIVGTQGLSDAMNNATTTLSGSWSSVSTIRGQIPPERNLLQCPQAAADSVGTETLKRLRNVVAHSDFAHSPEALSALIVAFAARAEAADQQCGAGLPPEETSNREASARAEAITRRLAATRRTESGDDRVGRSIPSETKGNLEERVSALEEQMTMLIAVQGLGDRSPS